MLTAKVFGLGYESRRSGECGVWSKNHCIFVRLKAVVRKNQIYTMETYDAPDDPIPSTDRQFMVPSDFPKPNILGSISGAQPKLLLARFEGKFYASGSTSPEVHHQWKYCETVAKQLAKKSVECKAGKRAHMEEATILDQYYMRLLKTGWVSDDEAFWTMRRCAMLLNWSLPDSLASD